MKLVGYLDGVEISFDFYPPNVFKTTIPNTLTGQYIIELHAIDEAGNQANISNIVVLINFDKLTFRVLKNEFVNKEKQKVYEFNELQSEFTYKELI